ncbi:hypothetical protein JW752_00565 [Candidatus Peregrinibacteria bacterium]|nr:hypothetical protein [Candidatus Peregrinibacteria bacterium]
MESFLIQITTNVINAINAKIDRTIELSPYILGALAVFLFGWILAELASRAINALGHKVKIEWLAEKIGLKHFLERARIKATSSKVIAKAVKGYLIFVFFIEATKIAKLTQISEFLTQVLNYIPDVIIAIFIMLVGIRMGHVLQNLITTSLSITKTKTANVLGMAAKYTMVTFAVLAALSELEIAEILIQTMFIGFIAMLTIAGGLAFGLGGKDVVHELLEDVKRVEVRKIRKNK